MKHFFPDRSEKMTVRKIDGPKKVNAVLEASQRAVSARVHPESGPIRAGCPKTGKWDHGIIHFLFVL